MSQLGRGANEVADYGSTKHGPTASSAAGPVY
jgi:hypothetical protein